MTIATTTPDFATPDDMAAMLGFKRGWLAKWSDVLLSHGAVRAGRRWHVEATKAAALEAARAGMKARAQRRAR